MTSRLPRPIGALALCVIGLGVVASLTACAPTVAMTPAPDANDPRCAAVTVRLPDTVAGEAKRTTDAQATGAWGDPAVVLLRCGVTPIGPTTKPCVSVKSGDITINWVLENDPSDTVLRYITFGRVPATELVIQHGVHGVSDANVLPAFNQAIASIPQGALKCQSLSNTP